METVEGLAAARERAGKLRAFGLALDELHAMVRERLDDKPIDLAVVTALRDATVRVHAAMKQELAR